MIPKEFQELPHRRYNPLSDEWVLVSPHRDKRPWNGKLEKTEEEHIDSESNYLLPGNQRSNGIINPDYSSTYVFDNDFAALLDDNSTINFERGLLRAKTERGKCRVVCFSPDSSKSLPKMSIEEIQDVIVTWIKEFKLLAAEPHINYVQVFENKGAIMGCSNPHPHGQIWAQESIPQLLQKEGKQQLHYYEIHKHILLLDYLEQEIQADERIVYKNEYFAVLVPFWAVWPYETLIIPNFAASNISEFKSEHITSFAYAIQSITKAYDRLFECSFPYSAGIHQAPTTGSYYPEWLVHMHFFPPLLRSASIKKFMVGYEMLAEPQRDLTPEKAASILKGLV